MPTVISWKIPLGRSGNVGRAEGMHAVREWWLPRSGNPPKAHNLLKGTLPREAHNLTK